eukprot:TRINITY_DN84_c1_g1_i2.p1 TRINITY_DN84_c1_g1~~TRINITY_DN84_c1_g1_i2.p1  ORF type:complete len:365 (-),score=57.87 TRINITY_DN84_c1_g1_i2:1211-2305(-)
MLSEVRRGHPIRLKASKPPPPRRRRRLVLRKAKVAPLQGFRNLAPSLALLLAILLLVLLSRETTIIDLVETTNLDLYFVLFLLLLLSCLYGLVMLSLFVLRWFLPVLARCSTITSPRPTITITRATTNTGASAECSSPFIRHVILTLYFLLTVFTLASLVWGTYKVLESQALPPLLVDEADPVRYEFASYPGRLADNFPRYIARLHTPESLFNSAKIVGVLSSILEGFMNAVLSTCVLHSTSQRTKAGGALPVFFTHPNNYTLLFQSPTMKTRMPWLARENLWMRDDVFAGQYLRGINPLSIRVVSHVLPPALDIGKEEIEYLENEVIEGGVSLEELLLGGRLFYADYSVLSQVLPRHLFPSLL